MRMSVGLIALATSANALSFTRHIQLSLLRPHLGTSSSSLLMFSQPRLPRTATAADNCPAYYEEYFPSPCKLRAAALGDAAGGGGGGGLAWQDAGATALVVAGAYALVSAFDNLTGRNLIQQVPAFSSTTYYFAMLCMNILITSVFLLLCFS